MPVNFFYTVNKFGKYYYEEAKTIPIDLSTGQSLIVLPIEDPSPHSANNHIQSTFRAISLALIEYPIR